MKRVPLLALSAIMMLTSCKSAHGPAQPTLVVVSYGGGTYQQSQVTSFEKPFASSNHVDVQSVVWGAEYGRLQEMVRSGSVPWDVVEVTAAQFARGKLDSLFEPLAELPSANTFTAISADAAPERFGVPNVYWSTVLAYKKQAYPNGGPQSWSDFWDVKRFPGPRALYDNPRATLEFALLASGVPKDHLYPLNVDRAFAMLDKIRPYVQLWWTDGTQPVNALLAGTVTMSPAWSGRIFAVPQAKEEIGYTWNGAAQELDYWVIPKGSKNPKLANDFILFASMPGPMAQQATLTGYGPANTLAFGQVPASLQSSLPTTKVNWDTSFVVDSAWWSSHEAEITQRWVRWRNK